MKRHDMPVQQRNTLRSNENIDIQARMIKDTTEQVLRQANVRSPPYTYVFFSISMSFVYTSPVTNYPYHIYIKRPNRNSAEISVQAYFRQRTFPNQDINPFS